MKLLFSHFSPGKTAFLNLLLYYASAMNVDVVLQNAAKFVFLLCSDGTVEHFPATDIDKVPALKSKDTFYLFNPDEKDTQARVSNAFTVIATSPDEKHYSEFRKIEDMSVIFLYPWSLDEARAAFQALQPTHELSTEQLATLNERFDQVGGSFRFLRYPQRKYTTEVKPELTSTEVIPLADLLTWEKIVREKHPAGKLVKVPHILFHCFPADDDSLYRLGFASPLSRVRVTTSVELKSQAEWDTFVSLMLRIDPSPSSVGLRYEHYVHVYMRNYGYMTTKISISNKDGGPVTTLEEVPVYTSSNQPEEDVANALHSGICSYIVPTKSNFAEVDSFYVANGTVYCFQITTSKGHGYNSTTFNTITTDIESAYLRKVEKDPGMKPPPTFVFCWVHDPITAIPDRKSVV